VSELQELKVDAIYVPANIREATDVDEEFVASFKRHGVIEPLIVRADTARQRLELVAGHRRLAAAKAAGLERVPCVVRPMTDQERDEIRLIENIQREDLTPLEEAKAIRAYLERHNVTQAQLGVRLGKSQAWVANRLRLLETPPTIQDYIRRGILSPSAVQEVLRAKDLPKGLERVEARLKQELERDEQLFTERGITPPGVTVDRARLVVDGVIDAATADLSRCEFDVEAECADCEQKIKARWGLRCTDKACWKRKNKAGAEAMEAAIVEKVRAGETISWQESHRLVRAFEGCPGECEYRRKAKVENGHSQVCCLNPDSDCYKERAKAERERENDWEARQKKVTKAREVFNREEEERLTAVEGYLARRGTPSVPEPAETRLLCLRVLREIVYDPDELTRFAELGLPELLAATVEAVLREETDVAYDSGSERYRPTCPAYEQVRDWVVGRETPRAEGRGETPEAPELEPHEEALAEQVAGDAEEELTEPRASDQDATCTGECGSCPNTSCPSYYYDYVPPGEEADVAEAEAAAAKGEAEPEPYKCPYTKKLVDSGTCRQCNNTVAAGGGGCCEYVIHGQAPFTCAVCERRHSCQTAQEQGVA